MKIIKKGNLGIIKKPKRFSCSRCARYSAISAILLLKREEAIILQSKKLENIKTFPSIKPQAFGKRRKLTDIEKEHKIAAYNVYAPKLKAKFTSFDEMGVF